MFDIFYGFISIEKHHWFFPSFFHKTFWFFHLLGPSRYQDVSSLLFFYVQVAYGNQI